jgi:exodeoxyribonuclease V alpha subunit
MIERREGAGGFVRGTLKILWRQESSAFVLGLVSSPGEEPVKVIGNLGDADTTGVRCYAGTMEPDRKRGGLIFRVAGMVDERVPLERVAAYLGSGQVAHVGPAVAADIVARFGKKTMKVLIRHPERLAEVPRITDEMIPDVRASLARSLHLAALIGLLVPLGIGVRACEQAARRWGRAAATNIEEHPWLLADLVGVGFARADRAALALGKPADAPERLIAAVAHWVGEAAGAGHTVAGRLFVERQAADDLDQPATAVSAAIDEAVAAGRLVAQGADGLALPHIAQAEARIARVFVRLLATDRSGEQVTDEEIAGLEAGSGITFDPEQRRAVVSSLEHGLTVLTGGPGTGKTTLVRAICDLAAERDLSVGLVSFTGKAAKRLAEATGRDARTIHSYLRYVPGSAAVGPEFEDDVVVVDETSMLDVLLADELLAWLPVHARLILVGDPDQVTCCTSRRCPSSASPPSTEPSSRPASPNSRAVNVGAVVLPWNGTGTIFRPVPGPDAVVAFVSELFVRRPGRIEDVQVITPMRIGPVGTRRLNAVIAEAVRGPTPALAIPGEHYAMCAGDRIIWLQNDRETSLRNGQIGRLLAVRRNGGATVEFDDETYQVGPDKVVAGFFELAYALTCHKVQGSEFPVVVVVVERSASRMLTRRLLYTAVSRARKNVMVVGDANAVARAVATHDATRRRTALCGLMSAPDRDLAIEFDEPGRQE